MSNMRVQIERKSIFYSYIYLILKVSLHNILTLINCFLVLLEGLSHLGRVLPN